MVSVTEVASTAWIVPLFQDLLTWPFFIPSYDSFQVTIAVFILIIKNVKSSQQSVNCFGTYFAQYLRNPNLEVTIPYKVVVEIWENLLKAQKLWNAVSHKEFLQILEKVHLGLLTFTLSITLYAHHWISWTNPWWPRLSQHYFHRAQMAVDISRTLLFSLQISYYWTDLTTGGSCNYRVRHNSSTTHTNTDKTVSKFVNIYFDFFSTTI